MYVRECTPEQFPRTPFYSKMMVIKKKERCFDKTTQCFKSFKFFLLVSCYRRHPKALPSTLLGSPLAPSWVLPTTPGKSETTRKWLFTSFSPKVLPAHCLTGMPHLSWSLLTEDLPRPWLFPAWDPYGAPMRLRACISFLWPFPALDSSKATC